MTLSTQDIEKLSTEELLRLREKANVELEKRLHPAGLTREPVRLDRAHEG